VSGLFLLVVAEQVSSNSRTAIRPTRTGAIVRCR